jgi:hypothetical protein
MASLEMFLRGRAYVAAVGQVDVIFLHDISEQRRIEGRASQLRQPIRALQLWHDAV